MQRTAARRAARRVNEGVAEQNAFARDPIHVGRLDDVVERRPAIETLVATGVTPPVIGEDKQDVPARRGFGGAAGQDPREQGEERAKQVFFKNCWKENCRFPSVW